MTLIGTDWCPVEGIPRPELAGISKLAHEILLLSGPSAPRRVVCAGGVPAEPLTHDELEHLHGRMADQDADEWTPRLLATVEALRDAP